MRSTKRLISALGITLLAAVFCGIVGVGSQRVSANSSAGATFTANMNDIAMTIEIPNNNISVNLDPTASLETVDLPVIVTTDAPYGYTLMMTSDTSNLTRTTMLNGQYPTIPTLSPTTNTFDVNHWGYKTPADGKFLSFDPSGVQVGYSDSAETAGKTETITFGAKANSGTPIGTYKIDLTLSALVNSRPLYVITDMTTMQQFEGLSMDDKYSILDSMTEGQPYTVKDSRDNQGYTIAKLFDGNIWMTKNLNLAGGTTLTPETSNVTSNYTLPASSTSGFSDNSTAYVYNSGSTSCGNNSPCYSYYSYIAATAGTNPSSGNATSDICPKGWRLPTQTEYNTLVGSYNTGAKLTASPFLAVYTGRYGNSLFAYGGSIGRYWSSTAYNSSNAYYLRFDSSDADIHYFDKKSGFSARCILK